MASFNDMSRDIIESIMMLLCSNDLRSASHLNQSSRYLHIMTNPILHMGFAIKYGDVSVSWRDWQDHFHRDNGDPARVADTFREWWWHGKRHRTGDLPAIEDTDGGKEWYLHGKMHRDFDLPASSMPSTFWIDVGGGIRLADVETWAYRGKAHRDGDKPARITRYGEGEVVLMEWIRYGKLHRGNDQPAKVYTKGRQEWYWHGRLHRGNDMPAVVDGISAMWFRHDMLHRGHDRPASIGRNGTKEWCIRNKLHRDHDRPAVIRLNGTMEWWTRGKRNRENNRPAVITADGIQEFWQMGRFINDQVPPGVYRSDATYIFHDAATAAIDYNDAFPPFPPAK
jgi:hypothetical protein